MVHDGEADRARHVIVDLLRTWGAPDVEGDAQLELRGDQPAVARAHLLAGLWYELFYLAPEAAAPLARARLQAAGGSASDIRELAQAVALSVAEAILLRLDVGSLAPGMPGWRLVGETVAGGERPMSGLFAALMRHDPTGLYGHGFRYPELLNSTLSAETGRERAHTDLLPDQPVDTPPLASLSPDLDGIPEQDRDRFETVRSLLQDLAIQWRTHVHSSKWSRTSRRSLRGG